MFFYVPNLDIRLLSVKQFILEGYSFVFEDLTHLVVQDKTKGIC